jgi:hypothetical protein
MNIELDEVVAMDVSDDALELAAGVALGRVTNTTAACACWTAVGSGAPGCR